MKKNNIMKKLLFTLALLVSFNSFGQKEKIYGMWQSESIETSTEDGIGVKVIFGGAIQFMRGGRFNFEGNSLFIYKWNDEEIQNILGSTYDINLLITGTWSVEEGFLITTSEHINPTINDEAGIQFVSTSELDESEKARMNLYNSLIDELRNLKGSVEEKIITLTKDIMVTGNDNTVSTYTKVKN